MSKVSLDQQIEEIEHALDYVEELLHRGVKKSMVDFRKDRLRGALRTLRWFKENETQVRMFADDLRKLKAPAADGA